MPGRIRWSPDDDRDGDACRARDGPLPSPPRRGARGSPKGRGGCLPRASPKLFRPSREGFCQSFSEFRDAPGLPDRESGGLVESRGEASSAADDLVGRARKGQPGSTGRVGERRWGADTGRLDEGSPTRGTRRPAGEVGEGPVPRRATLRAEPAVSSSTAPSRARGAATAPTSRERPRYPEPR